MLQLSGVREYHLTVADYHELMHGIDSLSRSVGILMMCLHTRRNIRHLTEIQRDRRSLHQVDHDVDCTSQRRWSRRA